MNNELLLHVKDVMNQYEAGHDFSHIERVIANARLINETEKGSWEVIELACLLHDTGDAKLTGSEETLISVPREIMERFGVEKETMNQVLEIIGAMSFSSGKIPNTLEGRIVQDADRLEAMGAIGIARCFSYGGKKGRPLWNPQEEILESYENAEEYHQRIASSLTHFDEKLFKLKDLMNTQAGKEVAKKRDEFMHTFYQQFKDEWFGKI